VAVEPVLTIAVLLVLAVPVGLAGGFMVHRGGDAIAQAFGSRPPEGWPHGVQEEDPSFDVTWRLGPPGAAPRPAPLHGEPRPAVRRVTPTVRPR
jgi:hypothetical protein